MTVKWQQIILGYENNLSLNEPYGFLVLFSRFAETKNVAVSAAHQCRIVCGNKSAARNRLKEFN